MTANSKSSETQNTEAPEAKESSDGINIWWAVGGGVTAAAVAGTAGYFLGRETAKEAAEAALSLFKS